MSSKKAKTSIDGDSSAAVMVVVQDEESWDKVVSYIQKCPHVSPNHPALQAAIKGVEQERKRRERDAKLQQRFAAEAEAAASAIPSPTRNETPVSISQSEILRTSSSNNNNNDIKMEEDDEDWHDVNAVGSASGNNNNGANDGTTTNGAAAEQVNNNSSNTSFLGERLATDSVRLLAQHSVQTKSPVAAMASIVHAALNCLDFTCTGIPDSGPSGGGFAAPVRAITAFLPSQWDAKANNNNNNKTGIVLLRYRQEGLGSVVLKVEETVVVAEGSASPKVRITWTPGATTTTSTEPSSTLDFALETHLNLESWNRASHNSTMPVAPSLHFKALAVLLTQLTQTLDLGEHGALQKPPIYGEASMPPILAAPNGTNGTTTTTASFQPPQPVLPQQQHPYQQGPDPSIGGGYGYEVPTTVHGAFPGLQVPRNGGGQFSGDLNPFMGGGGIGGSGMGIGGGGGGMSGNLMGPNHPSFGGMGGMPPGDNGYLRPRIDPYGPPPTHPEQQQQPQHPSLRRPPAPGTPNHDHLRPPNNLNNNNMFM